MATIVKDGKILWTVVGPPSLLALQCPEGAQILDGNYPSDRYEISAEGQPVAKAAARVAAERAERRAFATPERAAAANVAALTALVADLKAAGIATPNWDALTGTVERER